MPLTNSMSNTHILNFPLPDLQLIKVEAGSFLMGNDRDMVVSDNDNTKPAHHVHIRNPFYIGQFQVTQQLYEQVMNENPSYRKGKRRPVENVSWNDTKKFFKALEKLEEIRKFKKKQKKQDYKFRLPSESEWEYVAKGGKNMKGEVNYLDQVGWYFNNNWDEIKPVGLLLPNELGLYDIIGNVYEWCEDDYHDSYKGAPDDGTAWVDDTFTERGSFRVLRGGTGWYNYLEIVGSESRSYFSPIDRQIFVGFRVVFALVQEKVG